MTSEPITTLAGRLYDATAKSVGKDLSGEPLPLWKDIVDDPKKRALRKAWVRVANHAANSIRI